MYVCMYVYVCVHVCICVYYFNPTTSIIIVTITSTSDLQPITAIANQLPGQLVYTQVTTRGPNCFKFIIALIMPSSNIVLTLYFLYHKACNAEAESTEIPATNMNEA